MSRALYLTLAIVLGCSKTTREDVGRHRPALSPAVATRLRNLSPDCTFAPSTIEGVAQIQKCTGGRGALEVHLDGERRIISLETTIRAASAHEAKLLLDNGLTGLVPPGALANAGTRFGKSTVAETETIEGIRVTVKSAAGDGFNLYTVTLAW